MSTDARRSIVVRAVAAALSVLAVAACSRGSDEAASDVITVPLTYQEPGDDRPAPNFNPRGTQMPLTPAAPTLALPDGAAAPARLATLHVGESSASWVPVLVTSDPEHPLDFTRLYFDLNRNDDFEDDGPGARFEAVPSRNERTGDWWSSFSDIRLEIPYASGGTEPFLVDAWIVRDGDAPPEIMRFSRRSWRSGEVEVDGVPALVAVMDANNDAVFGDEDMWSVIEAGASEAQRAVLSIGEARSADRMMFVRDANAGREIVLEFRGLSPDGRQVSFAVVDYPITKAEDRRADDAVAEERTRPRTTTPVTWLHGLDEALAAASSAGKPVLVDFETVWCMPCKTMDEWIWSDAEVAALINDGYVAVKLDGDLEEAIVERYEVAGYPTMMILDASGAEQRRAVGYKTSVEMRAFLSGTNGT